VRGGRRDSLRNCRTLRRRGQGPSAQEGRRAGVLVPELPAAQRREPRPTRSGSPARLRSFCQQDPPPGLVAYLDSPGTPSWDRAGQLLLGGAVALVAVRRGRWAAVPLAVVVARLLLDPATYPLLHRRSAARLCGRRPAHPPAPASPVDRSRGLPLPARPDRDRRAVGWHPRCRACPVLPGRARHAGPARPASKRPALAATGLTGELIPDHSQGGCRMRAAWTQIQGPR